MATGSVNKVIDSGTGYIRYEDGTQICYGSFQKSLAANNYTEHLLRYPAAFANGVTVVPVCTVQVWSDPKQFSVIARGAGQVELTLRIGNTGSAVDVTVWWIAIGRWK